MKRIFWYPFFPVALLALVVTGCGVGQDEVDEAYASGYADGLASANESLVSAEKAYDTGYQEGLADAEEKANADLCQNCYALGFSEGYQSGLSDGSAGRESEPSE